MTIPDKSVMSDGIVSAASWLILESFHPVESNPIALNIIPKNFTYSWIAYIIILN